MTRPWRTVATVTTREEVAVTGAVPVSATMAVGVTVAVRMGATVAMAVAVAVAVGMVVAGAVLVGVAVGMPGAGVDATGVSTAVLVEVGTSVKVGRGAGGFAATLCSSIRATPCTASADTFDRIMTSWYPFAPDRTVLYSHRLPLFPTMSRWLNCCRKKSVIPNSDTAM